jgi:DNA-binding NtrC family response regulator
MKLIKNLRILLIDDDEWIRDSMSMYFEDEGCYLQTLRSAEDALEALINESFDIIIADYKLPGIDGLEFFKKADELNSEAVKILITAYGSKELFTKALNMGIHDCIEKPFTSETIEDSLKRLLNIDR